MTAAETRTERALPSPVALLLPGQGAQHVRMAAGLHGEVPTFTEAVEEVFAAMGREGRALRSDWLSARPRVHIDHATRAQPLLFAVDYGLCRLLLGQGVRPAALLGHSMGEVVAAVVAGVFSLEDACALALDRVERVLRAPAGGMAAVSATPRELEPHLHSGVAVGGVNAPRQTVLAGPETGLDTVLGQLRERGFSLRRIPSLTGFHSPLLDEVLKGSEDLFEGVRTRAPEIPVYSGYTAALLTADQAGDPSFWAGQPAAPVMFWPALERLLADGPFTLVEAGPGQGLSQLARRHPAVRAGHSAVLSMLPARPGTAEDDLRSVRTTLEKLRNREAP
ncbi:acyltransferase domain-containing protein [Nocardiopsis alborubida]|nr:acyltransferase domain-containing protein [Nocardiopsis alborubida]